MASTHYSKLAGKLDTRTTFPVDPFDGQEFYDTTLHIRFHYDATNSAWRGEEYSTTTSTSTSSTTTSTSTSQTTTSTTTTSTSTTTTSTSSSTTTSISTSTSTSTTTTL